MRLLHASTLSGRPHQRPRMLRRLLGAARPLAVRASAAAPLCTRVALGATVASSLVPSPSACAANGGGMPLGLPTSLPSLPSITDVSMLQVELLTVSGLSGYTAGYACKRAFKVLVFTSGCIFIGLQTLASNGLITVHFDEMEKRLRTLADLNKDGVVDGQDLQSTNDKLQAYLSAGLPSAGTFSAGFLFGMRS